MGSLEEDHRRLHEAARRQIFAPQGPEQEISLPVQGLFPVPIFSIALLYSTPTMNLRAD